MVEMLVVLIILGVVAWLALATAFPVPVEDDSDGSADTALARTTRREAVRVGMPRLVQIGVKADGVPQGAYIAFADGSVSRLVPNEHADRHEAGAVSRRTFRLFEVR